MYKEILQSFGYSLTDLGKEYRTSALYRDGGNKTALCIFKDNGRWIDFVSGQRGTFSDLIKLNQSAGLESNLDLRDFLNDNASSLDLSFHVSSDNKLKFEKFFPQDSLDGLLPNNFYWNERGITDETLSDFNCGLSSEGKMYQRYVFPVFNKNQRIIGMAGRSVNNSRSPKWKLLGGKQNFIYPFFNKDKSENFACQNSINQLKTVILVESIGDMLKLWQNDIKNVLVLFGTSLSSKLKCHLVSLNLENVIVATNNDEKDDSLFGENVGLDSAKKIKSKLSKIYNKEKIKICLPNKNDFGILTDEEVLLWKQNLNLN